MKKFFVIIGENFISTANIFGGIFILIGRCLKALIPPKIDYHEFKTNLYIMGNKSLVIVIVTALLTGAIGVIQAAYLVKRYGAYGLVGAGAGFVVLREIGPILIAVMFSGRVGSNNTAQLGTMVVTEQIDALRILCVEPIRYLVVPRVIAMLICIVSLTVYGDMVALFGGAITSKYLLGIEYSTYINGMLDWVKLWDFATGIIKSFFFGLVIAFSSCYYGLSVKGGAPAVGKAVNNSVVTSAVGIFLLDYIVTYVLEAIH